MGIKSMSYTTCEQVLFLREAAIRMEEQRDQLAEALRFVISRIDGDLRATARDVNNGIGSGNDIYGDCDIIEARALEALQALEDQ